MSVGMAILVALAIVILTFIVIIFNICDFMIIDKFFPKLNKKIVSFITIVGTLVYIILILYNFINDIFK